MRLASSSEVVSLADLPAGINAEPMAQAALEAVTPIIEQKLDTPVVFASYIDLFDYSIPKYRRAFAPVEFRLSAGFIDASTFKLYESADGLLLADNGGIEVNAQYYKLDAVRGILQLLKDVKEGSQTLRAVYDAGFEDSDGELQDVPEWLKQAAILTAVRVARSNPLGMVNKKTTIYQEVQNAYYDAVSSIVNSHARPRMGLVWPVRSVVENG